MISDKDMTHLKALARLELGTEETLHLKDELNKILESFEQIKDLDTEGVEELARPIAIYNVFRLDEVKPPLPIAEALKLAVEEDKHFFKVPRTVDSGE